MKNFTVVILAGGEGKRMKSTSAKALYDLAGQPLIYYPLKEVLRLKKRIKEIIVVTGHKAALVEEKVRKCFFPQVEIKFVYQLQRLGTANALEIAYKKAKHQNILVLCADTPLIRAQTLRMFMLSFLKKKLSCSVLIAHMASENSLGVVLKDEKGGLRAIREKNLLNSKAGKSGLGGIGEEVNSGIYCFKREALKKNISRIKKNKLKKEYFLTDIVEILYKQGQRLDTYFLDNFEEISGINTQKDLWAAAKIMRYRCMEQLAASGVKIIDPETTFIETGVVIGKNTTIYPFTFIEKGVIIGTNCFLGPYVRLRGGSQIGNDTQVGNFLEINRTQIGKKVKVKHFGYLGDTRIAEGVNIGAGTVVANYDGKSKQKTKIGKDAFIGSDTVLVAPVKVGRGAVTGAGSVVTKDIKPNTVVVGVPAKKLVRKGKRG